MSAHRLKTWPEPFEATWRKAKAFEVRRDDRGYRVGDGLRLYEWDPSAARFLTRRISTEITYVTRDAWGLPPGIVVLGLNLTHRFFRLLFTAEEVTFLNVHGLDVHGIPKGQIVEKDNRT